MVVKSGLSFKNYKELSYINSDLFPTNWEIIESEPNDFMTSLVKSGMDLEEVKDSIETSVIGLENEFTEFLEDKISSHDMSIYDIIVSIFFGVICAVGIINSILILKETKYHF
jgi:hypothetical protein